jgi:hypothetical protein
VIHDRQIFIPAKCNAWPIDYRIQWYIQQSGQFMCDWSMLTL